MANENIQFYPPGYTLYFTIRDLSGLVWYPAGAVMETWGTGSRTAADYDIGMTDKSGDVYMGTIPTNLPDGVYMLVNRRQIGATPHDTNDGFIGGGRGRWLGGQWWDDDTSQLNTVVNAENATHIYTVTESNGIPIQGALVEAKQPGTQIVVQTAISDSQGQAIFFLAPGTYDFYAYKAGYTFTNPDQEVVS